MKKKRNSYKIDFVNFIVPVGFLAAWVLLPAILHTPEYLIPSLKKTGMGLVDFVFGTFRMSPYAGTFWKHSVASWHRVLAGFLIASFLGTVTGMLTGYFQMGRRLLDPFIHMIRMVPGIGWFPLAMVWFGVGNRTTVFLITLAAFFPGYVNTLRAVRDVPPMLLDVGRVMGAGKWQLFKMVILPLSLPGIFTGLRLGMGICWAYLVLGELTGVNEGLGAVMMDARMLGNVDMIIVCMIVIAVWGRIGDLLLLFLYRRVKKETDPYEGE